MTLPSRFLAVALLAAGLPAQSDAVVPAVLEHLPGNAAVSMPLRWERGTMQTILGAGLLPANLSGKQITRLRLRRPGFPGEPGYGSIQRTLRVVMAMTTRAPNNIARDLDANFPRDASGNRIMTEVVPPTPVTIAATSPRGPRDAVGGVLLDLPLATPFTVGSGNLLVQFETHGTSFGASAEHWVDAVHLTGGVDRGFASEVGGSGCTTTGAAPPMLYDESATPPVSGGRIRVRLANGIPGAVAVFVLTVQPQARGRTNLRSAFDRALRALRLGSCTVWTLVVDDTVTATADSGGGAVVEVPVPSTGVRPGDLVGIQAFQASGSDVALSNGVYAVLDNPGIGPAAGTVFDDDLPNGGTQWAAWAPFPGLAPVIEIEYR